jgi:hypothetical protein
MGVNGDAVFRALDDPNDVTLWHDFESAEAARSVLSAAELRDAMQRAGVQGDPQAWLVNPS